ncbi:MAG TPA: alpha/beta hydrolase [Microbacteriaceae bacterium]|nr:alpha/beta hydrolase [Microbacteriaceae bacterium]
MSGWNQDILGDNFFAKTIHLGVDEEGPIETTVVRSLPQKLSRWQRATGKKRKFENLDVLYVHGWSDYFFQKELADFWTSRGARFFALDLRKYGRSLREYQTPGYVDDLKKYDQEIHAALNEMVDQKNRKRILLGHSTGGLTLSLWAARNPERFDALILNSPWLEFQFSAAARIAFTPLVEISARFAANEPVPQIDMGYYARAQREVAAEGHPLEIDETWRPVHSMIVRPGWLNAIVQGHAKVATGLNINRPILVLLSQRSEFPSRWDDSLKYCDSVLNVENIAKASLHLGSVVTIKRVDNALHDVFLSVQAAREDAYRSMENWVVGILAAQNQ